VVVVEEEMESAQPALTTPTPCGIEVIDHLTARRPPARRQGFHQSPHQILTIGAQPDAQTVDL
jgi:hypothetical protein